MPSTAFAARTRRFESDRVRFAVWTIPAPSSGKSVPGNLDTCPPDITRKATVFVENRQGFARAAAFVRDQ